MADRLDRPPRRLRPAGAALSFAALAGACGGPSPEDAPPAPPPILGQVAPFALLDQDGAPFGLADLAGRVWVADFLFTRCPSICPALTRSMQDFSQAWRKDERVGFLSFSVDAAFDRPEVLRRYAAERFPPIPRWTLLTGDPAEIARLSRESFRLAVSGSFEAEGDVTHSSRFVLLDGEGRIRGYYDSQDAAARARLAADLRGLLAELPAPAAPPPGSGARKPGS